MDITTLLSFLPLIQDFVQISPKVKTWIDTGVSVVTQLQVENPKYVSIFESIGKALFPKLTTQVHAVAAAADAIFDPHGTQWIQTSLNTLGATPPLVVDGNYGQKTKDAVSAFQTSHQPDAGPVDGWAGTKTELVIMSALGGK